jgi:hypothetical protein
MFNKISALTFYKLLVLIEFAVAQNELVVVKFLVKILIGVQTLVVEEAVGQFDWSYRVQFDPKYGLKVFLLTL